jgi:hypothetical protein
VPNRTRPHRSILAFIAILTVIASGSPAAAASPTRAVVLRAPDREVRAADLAKPVGAAAVPVRPFRPASIPEWITDPVVVPAVPGGADVPGGDFARTAVAAPEPKVPRTESGAALRGRNRMWMPSLGISKAVSSFSCSSSAYPGNRVYRWGCAGRNNVYLFGHAHSVFKPLHDAYVRGRLQKGMKVYYADGDGKISTYSVRWWKVTTPDRGEFAYASQARPSLTLQTCVGKRSQYRLIVRLVKVG